MLGNDLGFQQCDLTIRVNRRHTHGIEYLVAVMKAYHERIQPLPRAFVPTMQSCQVFSTPSPRYEMYSILVLHARFEEQSLENLSEHFIFSAFSGCRSNILIDGGPGKYAI